VRGSVVGRPKRGKASERIYIHQPRQPFSFGYFTLVLSKPTSQAPEGFIAEGVLLRLLAASYSARANIAWLDRMEAREVQIVTTFGTACARPRA